MLTLSLILFWLIETSLIFLVFLRITHSNADQRGLA